MLTKFFNVPKLGPLSIRGLPKGLKGPKIVAQPEEEPGENRKKTSAAAALKIVHAGGVVECHYMAVPAKSITKKYPSYVLARPEVFRRPWESVVRSHEILTPGEKLYLVPRRTVRKLRQKIEKRNAEHVPAMKSFVSVSDYSSINDVSKDGFSFTTKSILIGYSSEVSESFSTINRRRNGAKKHVKFAGIDYYERKAGSAATRKSRKEAIAKTSKKRLELHTEGRRKAKHGVLWQPSLTSITED